MRHGESAHNPHVSLGKRLQKEGVELERAAQLLATGRGMLNPGLTEAGYEQAQAVRAAFRAKNARFDLVVTTPLARTIETTRIVAVGFADRILVTPELCETADENLGGPQRGYSLQRTLEAYPYLSTWDTSHIRERGTAPNWVQGAPISLEPTGQGFYNPRSVEERLSEVIAWLRDLREQRVLIIGHSGVLNRILGRQTRNCECIEHELPG